MALRKAEQAVGYAPFLGRPRIASSTPDFLINPH
jgi:hypothetical protein